MRWTFTRSRRPAGGVLAIDHRRLRVTPSPDMTDQTSPFRIAYLTGVYPLASHTFIQREIASLRALGSEITITSIRRPEAKEIIGPEEEAAQEETFYVLAAAKNPLRLLGDHLALFAQSPARWLKALALALRTNRPGLKGFVWQFFYFAEAGVLARHLQKNGVSHQLRPSDAISISPPSTVPSERSMFDQRALSSQAPLPSW